MNGYRATRLATCFAILFYILGQVVDAEWALIAAGAVAALALAGWAVTAVLAAMILARRGRTHLHLSMMRRKAGQI